MDTRNPVDAVTQFVNAMNNGDLETALNLYEPGAAMVSKTGEVTVGSIALREALAGFAALRPTMTSDAQQVVEAGDIALFVSKWNLSGTDPDGNAVEISGRSSDILRRQPDGNWLIALDNPWGTDILP
jgi:uncharacterized protein (TIGR02246 family)